MIEYFLDTEAQELEFEIARLRPRLNQEFFSHLKFELGQLRFAVSKTQDMEDRLIELEALQKALLEGTEAYDNMQADLITARKSLTKILTSKDVKATLLELVEQNKINRSLLTLLDENIANAQKSDQILPFPGIPLPQTLSEIRVEPLDIQRYAFSASQVMVMPSEMSISLL